MFGCQNVNQVREGLLEDLMTGKLEQGAKLPNENVLAERFSVSRATIREAVLGLMDAGYLVRRHGSGTYVMASPRARHALETTVSYTAMIREAGYRPGETVLGKVVRAPTDQERKRLALGDDDSLVEVERVRRAGRRPVIYSRDRSRNRCSASRREARSTARCTRFSSGRAPGGSASAQLLPTLADAKLARATSRQAGRAAAAHRPGRLRRARAGRDALNRVARR